MPGRPGGAPTRPLSPSDAPAISPPEYLLGGMTLIPRRGHAARADHRMGCTGVSRNGHGAMPQELDPHADARQPMACSASRSGPRATTARADDRALANTPDRETTMSENRRRSQRLCRRAGSSARSGWTACRLLRHPRPVRPPDRDGRPPGHDAPADGRSPQRRGANCHPRLLRGRPGPRHHG